MLSKARRTVYYRRGMNIPKKYADFSFDAKGFLIDPKTGERVVKNKRSAGTPRYLKLAGNWFVSNQSEHVRRKAVHELKKYYAKELSSFGIPPFKADDYPLRVTWEVHCPIGKADWDLDNLWFYWKYFCDTLRKLGVIEDDTIRYVTSPPAPVFIPVETEEERKFVFQFFFDDRDEIHTNEFWRAAA